MENYSEKKFDEEKRLKYLQDRKEENLKIIQQRVHDLEIEKQKRNRAAQTDAKNTVR
jgi:hypothetical protein